MVSNTAVGYLADTWCLFLQMVSDDGLFSHTDLALTESYRFEEPSAFMPLQSITGTFA